MRGTSCVLAALTLACHTKEAAVERAVRGAPRVTGRGPGTTRDDRDALDATLPGMGRFVFGAEMRSRTISLQE